MTVMSDSTADDVKGEVPEQDDFGTGKRGWTSFSLVALVVVAVTILVIGGHLSPRIALGTVAVAGGIGIELDRRFRGLPPTRLTGALKQFTKTLFTSSNVGSSRSADEQPVSTGRVESSDGTA
jgi:hypothetical protein